MSKHQYTIILHPDPDEGGYTVTVPALPGCVTEGETIEEAIAVPLSLPTTPLPPGTPGNALLQLRFLSSREDAEAMERALEDYNC